MVELIIFNPNVLKNGQFTIPSNQEIDSDGITPTTIWKDINSSYASGNNDWSIVEGKAVALGHTGGYNDTFYQDILKVETDYTVRITIAGIVDVNLKVGSTTQHIGSAGVFTYNLNSGSSTVFAIQFLSGIANIDRVECIEAPIANNLDLTDNITIPLTFSIADIKDISKRNTSFSKTVTIPGTHHNNTIFNHLYEISGDSTFNPNKKLDAVVLEDGIQIFNGIIRLSKINRNDNGFNNYSNINYEIILLGKLADIFASLGEIKLNEFDWSEFDHTYTRAHQAESWSTKIQKNGVDYVNWTNGSNKTITSCQNNGGRVQVNFSGSHGFALNDQIYINVTTGSTTYQGDHKVYQVVSASSVVIYYPFDFTNGTTLTGVAYEHVPTGEGYVYPMINYGITNGTRWDVPDFYPAVYTKQYIDKIFKFTGFTYESSFLTGDMFKRLIVPYNKDKIQLSLANKQSRMFRASMTSEYVWDWIMSPTYSGPGSPGTYQRHTINYAGSTNPPYNPIYNPGFSVVPFNDDSTTPNYDYNNTYNTTLYEWTCPVTGDYQFDFNLQLVEYFIDVPGYTFSSEEATNMGSAWQFTLVDPSTATPSFPNGYPIASCSVNQFVTLNQYDTTYYNKSWYGSFLATAGHKYKLTVNVPQKQKMFVKDTSGNGYSGDVQFYAKINVNSNMYNTVLTQNIDENAQLDFNLAVPDIKASDFLKNIISFFNLYIEPDKDNETKLIIEPRNDYYASGSTLNWTSKLDKSQQIEINPLSELSNKTYFYTMKEDKDYYSDDHKKKAGIGYGDYKKIIDNDFVTGESKTESAFSAGVLDEYPAGTNRIITQLYKNIGERTATNIRLLYYGVRGGVSGQTWQHHSNDGTDISYLEYPYCGHMDNVEGPQYDFNFWYPAQVYYTYDSWTNGNVFNIYHRNGLEELINKNSKIITAFIYLNGKDISNLNFRNTYLIDGHLLRLNKIIDYNSSSEKPTRCEFLKVEVTKRYVATGTNGFISQAIDTIDAIAIPLSENTGTSGTNVPSDNISVQGSKNNVSRVGSRNVTVSGDNNTVGPYSRNVNIQSSDNTILGGLENVTIIGTGGYTITESNTSIINGIIFNSNGVITNNNINLIDAGLNNVLGLFGSTIINKIDAGNDAVLNLGTYSLTNKIDTN